MQSPCDGPKEDIVAAEGESQQCLMQNHSAWTEAAARELGGCAFLDQQPCLMPHDKGVIRLPKSPVLVFCRNKDRFDDFWAVSMANVLNKLHGKIVVLHLVKLRLTSLEAVPAGMFPPAPAFVKSSPWSSYLWIEVSTTPVKCKAITRQPLFSMFLLNCLTKLKHKPSG